MKQDKIRAQMASELYVALVKAGKDPAHPPTDSKPPADRAWREYCARGGEQYDDPEKFMEDLLVQTVTMAEDLN